MRFSSWYLASQIELRAPTGAGVFQVRGASLSMYPTGRSAMVHYGASESLRGEMQRWAQADGRAGCLYRHADDLDTRSPSAVLERLLERFGQRFGAPPGFR